MSNSSRWQGSGAAGVIAAAYSKLPVAPLDARRPTEGWPDRSTLGGFEPVAHAGLGEEVAGHGRVGLQLAADPGDEHPQVISLLAVLRPPHLLQELALADQLAAVAHQHLDQVPLGRCQAYLALAGRDALGGQVDPEVGGLHDRG